MRRLDVNELDDKTTILAKKLLDSLVGTRNVLGLHDPEDEYHRGKIDGWITAVNWLRRLVCAHARVEQLEPLTDEQIRAAPQANIQNVSLDMYRAEQSWCHDPAHVKIGPGTYQAEQRRALGITPEEAKAIIDKWYESYPAVKKLVESATKELQNADGSTSAYGRRRQVGSHGAVGACERGDQCRCSQDSAEPVDRHEGAAGGSGLQAIGGGLDRRQAPPADSSGSGGAQSSASEEEFRAWHIGDPKHKRRFVSGFRPDPTGSGGEEETPT
jgi:hypothetical protein